MNKELTNKITEIMHSKDNNLSQYASKNEEGIRLKSESSDIRPNYFRDTDRIIYSLAYNRYIDKTQVFTFNENDHISKRMIHVQMVSKIARTIGRALSLNEDLIEAASLGHDLGHPPFGHTGEMILNKISLKCGEGYFNHNIQSVRTLLNIENNGLGNNLCIQTLDAIMCHNGELEQDCYQPVTKTKEQFIQEYYSTYKNLEANIKLKPTTLEGCVVRISDIIAYIGRDIEDAIRIGIINKTDIPKNIKNVLGDSNREIINTFILDIIENSFNKPYIALSQKVFNALKELKKFNYENIYKKANTKEQTEIYEIMFNTLFNVYYTQLTTLDKECNIYKNYLTNMDKNYQKNNTIYRIIIDYIAGMTDDYFLKQYTIYKNYTNNKKLEYTIK